MPVVFALGALGPIFLNIQGIFTILDVCNAHIQNGKNALCMIQTYHSTKALPSVCLVGKIIKFKPVEPTNLNIWDIFTTVCVGKINIYHHTNQARHLWLLWLLSSSWPLIFKYMPWGPHISTYRAYLLLQVWGWQIPITKTNWNLMTAFIAKKKRAPLPLYIGPWGPHTSSYGLN